VLFISSFIVLSQNTFAQDPDEEEINIELSELQKLIIKNGFFYNWVLPGSVEITYSFSGKTADGFEICTLAQTATTSAETKGVKLKPRDDSPIVEFTDFVIIKQVHNGVEFGSVTYYDPPGEPISKINLPVGVNGLPSHTFVFVGKNNYGPVTTNVPTAMNGFESNGVPKIFVAEIDGNGHPLVNSNGGHCFTPSLTRVNDESGNILPQFSYDEPIKSEIMLEIITEPSNEVLIILLIIAIIIIAGILFLKFTKRL